MKACINILAVKVIYNVFITSKMPDIQIFLSKVKGKYELGTTVYGPGDFFRFRLQVIRELDTAVNIYGDEKLYSSACFPISRNRRKMVDGIFNEFELRSFSTVNSSLSWLATNISLFCSFYSSRL